MLLGTPWTVSSILSSFLPYRLSLAVLPVKAILTFALPALALPPPKALLVREGVLARLLGGHAAAVRSNPAAAAFAVGSPGLVTFAVATGTLRIIDRNLVLEFCLREMTGLTCIETSVWSTG